MISDGLLKPCAPRCSPRIVISILAAKCGPCFSSSVISASMLGDSFALFSCRSACIGTSAGTTQAITTSPFASSITSQDCCKLSEVLQEYPDVPQDSTACSSCYSQLRKAPMMSLTSSHPSICGADSPGVRLSMSSSPGLTTTGADKTLCLASNCRSIMRAHSQQSADFWLTLMTAEYYLDDCKFAVFLIQGLLDELLVTEPGQL